MALPAVPLSRRAARQGRASARICPVLADGALTTVHVAAYAGASTDVRVATLAPAEPLVSWCARAGVRDAIVGGFFLRSRALPLGELRIDGESREHVPFDAPWDRLRACVHVDDGRLRIAPRPLLPARPAGDLLQAGPLLVDSGRNVVSGVPDPEGFSSASGQFDADITAGRYPRAAIATGGGLTWAIACDGRSPTDAGMTLTELADFALGLGAETAINLDGGGSASLVCGGTLVNCPREEHGADLAPGRAVHTALVFAPRA